MHVVYLFQDISLIRYWWSVGYLPAQLLWSLRRYCSGMDCLWRHHFGWFSVHVSATIKTFSISAVLSWHYLL